MSKKPILVRIIKKVGEVVKEAIKETNDRSPKKKGK